MLIHSINRRQKSLRVLAIFCIGLAVAASLAGVTPAFAVPAPQNIAFTPIADKAVTDPPFNAVATGGGSGNPVTFTSNTPAVCTATGANGATITPVTTGFCSIAANQAALGVTFLAAPTSTQAFFIKLGQIITFAALTDKISDDPPFEVTASSTAIGSGVVNPIIFSSLTPTVCETGGINGATVTLLKAGICTIQANQAGNGTYVAAQPVNQSFNATPILKVTASIIGAVNGSIAPFGRILVLLEDKTEFTITANPGYLAQVGGTCGGAFRPIGGVPPGGNTSVYVITPFTENCTVTFTFVAQRPSLTISGVLAVITPALSTPAPTSSQENTPATFAATLRGAVGVVDAATLSFFADGIAISGCENKPVVLVVADDVSGYQATCTTATLAIGARVITARFAGNANNFAAITDAAAVPSQALTHTVIVAPPIIDTTPDAFSFVAQTGLALSAVVTSNAVSISGINSPATISVSGLNSAYSIGCTASFTTATGTINNGQLVCLRQTASALNNTTTNTTLSIGGVIGVFSTTTLALVPDTTPDGFSFVAQTGLQPNALVTSNAITISGINTPAPISVSGGGSGSAYSIGCNGVFSTIAGSIANGQSVCIRQTTSTANNTTVSATLSVGGVSAVFSATTVDVVPDTTPDAFSFPSVSGAAAGGVYVSNAFAISGINSPTSISVSTLGSTGVAYSIGCGTTFITTPSTVSNGNLVCIRVTANQNDGASAVATLVVGGVAGSFTVSNATTIPAKRFRIYIPSTQGHLFTTDENEYNVLTARAPNSYLAEGVDHSIYRTALTKDGQATVPYYRLYLRSVRQHFWTTEANEYNTLRADSANVGDDGIDGHLFLRAGVVGTVPLYRLSLAGTAVHHWTTDANEFKVLIASGAWIGEGASGNAAGVTGYVWPK